MSKALTMLVAIWILGLVLVAEAVQEEHLVALYLFDEGSGDTVVDSSGNGNDGEIVGGVERVAGKVGGALDFNGSDGHVLIPNSDSLSLTTGLTIAMWGFWRNYSSAGGVGLTKETAYKAGVRDHRKMMIRFSTAAINWTNVVDGTTEVPLEEWHHVAATYDADSGDGVVYFDGVEDGRGSFDGEVLVNANPIWIGRGANPYHDGLYDEVAVWNIALSEAEIAQAMNSLLPVAPSGKLTAVWAEMKGRR